jgi:hypothetical protein
MFDIYAQPIRVLGIVLAYLITFAGLIAMPAIFSISRSWWIGFFLVVAFIPIIPALQTILMGKRQASLQMIFKVYVAEYASLLMQLLFLAVSAPLIAVAVFSRLVIMLLIAASISWPIIGLQQLGLKIGSKLSTQDIKILFWVTLGLVLLAGIYYILDKLARRYADNYFAIWAKAFITIRDFFRY